MSTKSFYREFQDLAHAGRFDRMINDFLENTDVTELSVQYPVNMRVFYGFNTLSADAAWDTYVTMYNSYSSGIFPMLYVLLLAGVAVAAVLFMRRETYAFHNHWLFHLPLEVSFAGLCICISLYEGMLDMMISYLEGSWSNIDMLTGGAINFLCWVLVFGAWFVSASCIVPVGSLGPVAYVKKYSLIYRFFPLYQAAGKTVCCLCDGCGSDGKHESLDLENRAGQRRSGGYLVYHVVWRHFRGRDLFYLPVFMAAAVFYRHPKGLSGGGSAGCGAWQPGT